MRRSSRNLKTAQSTTPAAWETWQTSRRGAQGNKLRALRSRIGYGLIAPSQASQRALDWFAFFIADIQTGFGPFLSVYLTGQGWMQTDIGFILSIGSIAALLSQVPGGWIVDAARSKLYVGAVGVIVIGISALLIATWPVFATIVVAELLHAAASSLLGPVIVAISLALVGYGALGPRVGRNVRFAAIGNGLAAVVLGASGYFLSTQALFYVTAALSIPALLPLRRIREEDIEPMRADRGVCGPDRVRAA